MLIIWLPGIWLPLHGYDFSDTPLWAGIFLLPLTAGFLASGPVAGLLSDRPDRAGRAGIRAARHPGRRCPRRGYHLSLPLHASLGADVIMAP
jgi:MFS family permease